MMARDSMAGNDITDCNAWILFLLVQAKKGLELKPQEITIPQKIVSCSRLSFPGMPISNWHLELLLIESFHAYLDEDIPRCTSDCIKFWERFQVMRHLISLPLGNYKALMSLDVLGPIIVLNSVLVRRCCLLESKSWLKGRLLTALCLECRSIF